MSVVSVESASMDQPVSYAGDPAALLGGIILVAAVTIGITGVIRKA